MLCSEHCRHELAGVQGGVLHLYRNGSSELSDAFQVAWDHFDSSYVLLV